MGTYEELKAAIQQVITTNGNNEITGALLQQTLLSIVNTVGNNATFAGIATPTTNPGTPDQNVFYLATEAGTYVNFNNIEISAGEAVILTNKTGAWVKNVSGFSTQQQLNELSEKTFLATAMLDLSKLIIPDEYYNPDGSVAKSSTPGSYNRLPIMKIGTSRVIQVSGFSNVSMTIRCLDASKVVIDSPYFSIGDTPKITDVELPESTEYIAIYFRTYTLYDGAYICTKDSAYYSIIKKENDLDVELGANYGNLSALLNLQSIIVENEYYDPNGIVATSNNYNRIPIIKVNSLEIRIVGFVNTIGSIRCLDETYSIISSITLYSSDTERVVTLPTGTTYIAIYYSADYSIPIGAYIAPKDSIIEYLDNRVTDVELQLNGKTERALTLEVWKDGQYVSYESSYLTNNSSYDVTQPIFLRKGEILVYKSLCQPHVAEVAKVLDHLLEYPIFIPLVAGRGDYNTENQYIIEEDGYYVLSVRDAEQYPSYVSTAHVLELGIEERVENIEQEVDELKNASGRNSYDMLYGKKYVACGDSFTAGTTEVFEEGIYKGKDKTYPYLIGLRTGMDVVNMAVSGMSMVQYEDSANYFSGEYFKGIPLDSDYITIKLGINDNNYNSPMGTIDDTTNETFYGAWNVVMEYLINNYPYAKIGIIVTNGANNEIMEAEREIARKWGVPFLDYADAQTPLMGRMAGMRSGVTSVALEARNNAFRTSETDTHPNAKAHEYESTFIEAFLRRL